MKYVRVFQALYAFLSRFRLLQKGRSKIIDFYTKLWVSKLYFWCLNILVKTSVFFQGGVRTPRINKPNGPKDLCKMSNNCFVKTARHLAEMFSRFLNDSCFANLNNLKEKRLDNLQVMIPFLRYLKGSCFSNLANVWAKHCLDKSYTHLKIIQDEIKVI